MSGATEIEVPETLHIEEESPPPEQQNRPLTAREQIMQTAVRRAHERMESELAQSAIYDEDARALGLVYPSEEEPEPAVAAPEPKVEPPAPVHVAPKQPEPAPVVQPPPQSQVRTISVEGRQFEVTDQQYAELARLGMVANAALHQYRQAPVEPAAPVQAAPAAPLVDPDQVRRVVREIQFGGEDAAAAALTEYTTGLLSRVPAPQPQIDANLIVHTAVAEARRQALFAQEQAVIRQEYEDIFSNPQRIALASLNVNAIRARNTQIGRNQSDLDIYREAGNMVREALFAPPRPGNEEDTPPAVQSPVVAPRVDVIERKRAAPRRTEVVDRRAPEPVVARAPTGSEIVEQMRKQRHQPSLR